jgi:hypothetical protein
MVMLFTVSGALSAVDRLIAAERTLVAEVNGFQTSLARTELQFVVVNTPRLAIH